MKSRGPGESVATHLSNAHSKQVQDNRMYVERVADILRFTAVQGIAQRGHDESNTSDNKGNYLELLNLLGKYDEIVKKKDGPANAIQDEILGILSRLTLAAIQEEMKGSQCFALTVDETRH